MSLVNLDVLNITEISATLEESGQYSWVRVEIETADGGTVRLIFHPAIEPSGANFKARPEIMGKLKNFFSLGQAGVPRAA